jgi:ABC-type nitrate/sulfonate/bicarbonate transport system ATPase subunit
MNDKPLRLESISRSFGATEVLKDFTLDVVAGEFVAIVGPSGCGKTTLLNLLAGFDKPTRGRVASTGQMRMVYQQDGLFPWRTVAENIQMGLRQVRDKEERERELKELLALIRLEGFENNYPHQLSGGMRQRAELARALAGNTDTLLLDEPFSALDYLTRLRLRRELARMLKERPRTVVLVTHDIEEAAQLADRVVVLSERPARIRCELRLEAERPRDPTHPEVVEATHRILTVLGLEHDNRDSEVLSL